MAEEKKIVLNIETITDQAVMEAYGKTLNSVLGAYEDNIALITQYNEQIKANKEEIKAIQKEAERWGGTTQKQSDAIARLTAENGKLAQAKAELVQITKNQEKIDTSIEGSMTNQSQLLGKLRMAWRNMTDEQKKANEGMGETIAQLDKHLKESDANIGNFQRNVGDYQGRVGGAFTDLRQQIKQLKSELLDLDEGSAEYNDTLAKLGEAQFKMKDMTEQAKYAVADAGEILNAVGKTAQGVVGGFNAFQGVMALVASESEDLHKTMLKLQAGMAIVQGLQGLEGMIDSMRGLSIVIKNGVSNVGTFIKSLNGIKAAMIGTGIGALVVGIGALVSAINDEKEAQEQANRAIEEANKAYERYTETLAAMKQEEATLDANLMKKYADEIAEASTDVDKMRVALERLREEQEQNKLASFDKQIEATTTAVAEATEKYNNLTHQLWQASVIYANVAFSASFKSWQELYDEQYAELWNKYGAAIESYEKIKNEGTKALQDLRNERKRYEAGAVLKDAEAIVSAEKKFTEGLMSEEERAYAHLTEQYKKDFELFSKYNKDKKLLFEYYLAEYRKLQDKYSKKEREEEEKKSEEARKLREKELAEIKKIEQEAIDSMLPSIAQELKQLQTKYDQQKALYDKYGKDTTNLTEAYEAEKAAIVKKYNDQIEDAVTGSLEASRKAFAEAINEARAANAEGIRQQTAQAQSELEAILEDIENEIANDPALNKVAESPIARALGLTDEELTTIKAQAQKAAQDIFNSIAKISQDATQRRLDDELDAIEREADSEKAILEGKLEKGLISQKEYEKKLAALDEETAARKEEANKEAFEKNKAWNIGQAIMNAALAISKVFATTGPPASFIMAGITAATTAAQIATIASQKYARGGMLSGPSHAQGGIPGFVGNRHIEAEGGEAIINKRSTAKHRKLLSLINSDNGWGVDFANARGGGGRFFARGGILGGYDFRTAPLPDARGSLAQFAQQQASNLQACVDAINRRIDNIRVLLPLSDLEAKTNEKRVHVSRASL